MNTPPKHLSIIPPQFQDPGNNTAPVVSGAAISVSVQCQCIEPGVKKNKRNISHLNTHTQGYF